MGNQKISLTHGELVAAFNSWWVDYKADPSSHVDYDADDYDYDDTTYSVDSANVLIKHINKIQGE